MTLNRGNCFFRGVDGGSSLHHIMDYFSWTCKGCVWKTGYFSTTVTTYKAQFELASVCVSNSIQSMSANHVFCRSDLLISTSMNRLLCSQIINNYFRYQISNVRPIQKHVSFNFNFSFSNWRWEKCKWIILTDFGMDGCCFTKIYTFNRGRCCIRSKMEQLHNSVLVNV